MYSRATFSTEGYNSFTTTASLAAGDSGAGRLPWGLHKANTYGSYTCKVLDEMRCPGYGHGNTRSCSSTTTQEPYTSFVNKIPYGQQQGWCQGAASYYGHQVFEEMPYSGYGYGYAQGSHNHLSTVTQSSYNSYWSRNSIGHHPEWSQGSVGGYAHQVLNKSPSLNMRVLSVTIHHLLQPITMEEIHKVFSSYGVVEKIIPSTTILGSRVLIQYQTNQMAAQTFRALHRRCLYGTGYQLDIMYAQQDEMNFLYASSYTQNSSSDPDTSKFNLAAAMPRDGEEDKCKQVPQVFKQMPSSNCTDVVTQEEQHPQLSKVPNEVLNQILSRVDSILERFKKREQEEQQKREQVALDKELEHFFQRAFDLFEEMSESEVVSESDTSSPAVILDQFFDGAFDFLDEMLINNTDVPRKCTKLSKQPLAGLKENVNGIKEHVLANESEYKELPYVVVVSFPHEITCIGGRFIKSLSNGHEEMLAKGHCDPSFPNTYNLFANVAIKYRTKNSMSLHQKFNKTILPDHDLYGQSIKSAQQLKGKHGFMLSAVDPLVLASEEVSRGLSSTVGIGILLLQGVSSKGNFLITQPQETPCCTPITNSKEMLVGESGVVVVLTNHIQSWGLSPPLQQYTDNARPILPWDPGDHGHVAENKRIVRTNIYTSNPSPSPIFKLKQTQQKYPKLYGYNHDVGGEGRTSEILTYNLSIKPPLKQQVGWQFTRCKEFKGSGEPKRVHMKLGFLLDLALVQLAKKYGSVPFLPKLPNFQLALEQVLNVGEFKNIWYHAPFSLNALHFHHSHLLQTQTLPKWVLKVNEHWFGRSVELLVLRSCGRVIIIAYTIQLRTRGFTYARNGNEISCGRARSCGPYLFRVEKQIYLCIDSHFVLAHVILIIACTMKMKAITEAAIGTCGKSSLIMQKCMPKSEPCPKLGSNSTTEDLLLGFFIRDVSSTTLIRWIALLEDLRKSVSFYNEYVVKGSKLSQIRSYITVSGFYSHVGEYIFECHSHPGLDAREIICCMTESSQLMYSGMDILTNTKSMLVDNFDRGKVCIFTAKCELKEITMLVTMEFCTDLPQSISVNSKDSREFAICPYILNVVFGTHTSMMRCGLIWTYTPHLDEPLIATEILYWKHAKKTGWNYLELKSLIVSQQFQLNVLLQLSSTFFALDDSEPDIFWYEPWEPGLQTRNFKDKWKERLALSTCALTSGSKYNTTSDQDITWKSGELSRMKHHSLRTSCNMIRTCTQTENSESIVQIIMRVKFNPLTLKSISKLDYGVTCYGSVKFGCQVPVLAAAFNAPSCLLKGDKLQEVWLTTFLPP